MLTIDRIPTICSNFFRPLRRHFAKRARSHFWGLTVAMAMGHEHTIERLNALLRGHTHRTNDGEFLWRSHWDESWVIREIRQLKAHLEHAIWREAVKKVAKASHERNVLRRLERPMAA